MALRQPLRLLPLSRNDIPAPSAEKRMLRVVPGKEHICVIKFGTIGVGDNMGSVREDGRSAVLTKPNNKHAVTPRDHCRSDTA